MTNYKRLMELEQDELVKILMLFFNGHMEQLFEENKLFETFDPDDCIDWWLIVDKDATEIGVDVLLKDYDERYEKSW